MTVTADQAYAYIGEPVTFTATVSPNPGGGTVEFVDPRQSPEKSLGVVPVSESDGTAVLTAPLEDNYQLADFLVYGWFSGFGLYVASHGGTTVQIRYLPSVAFPEPPGPTRSTVASIPFIVGPGVATECRLDGDIWAACTSPWTATGLAEGIHTLEVRGLVDGRTGPAYSVSWPVDLTPPVPGSIALDGGVASTNHQNLLLTYPATDALSGIERVRVARTGAIGADGNLALDPPPFGILDQPWGYGPSMTFSVNLTRPSGPQGVWVQWFDAAGNASPIVSTSIDVRVAWPSLGGAWATTSPTVPFSLTGIDASEVKGIRISNIPTDWEAPPPAVELSAPPTTWSLVDQGYTTLAVPGFRIVEVQWLDEHGQWSTPRRVAINLLSDARPDIVLDEGATVTLDPVVQADLSIGAGLHEGYPVSVAYSCDGTTWSAESQTSDVLFPIYVDRAEAGCPALDGPRTISVRWRWNETAWSEVSSVGIDYERDPSLPSDDSTAPSGSVALAGDAAATSTADVTLAVPAADTQSGVASLRISNNGASWTTRPYAPTQPWTLPAGTGEKSVWVAWRDGAANWSTPVETTVELDTVKPVATAPSVRFARGAVATAGGSFPVVVAWTGSDVGSGIDHYQLAVSLDGGAYADVSSALRSGSTTRLVAAGHTYRFRVRALDTAGNVGAWAMSTLVRPTRIDDKGGIIRYGGSWRTLAGSALIGRAEHASSQRGATARVLVTGRGAAWVATTGPTRGIARVYLDGVLAGTIDLAASSAQSRRVVWTAWWGTSRTRTLLIRVSGTIGRPRVGVDAVAVLR